MPDKKGLLTMRKLILVLAVMAGVAIPMAANAGQMCTTNCVGGYGGLAPSCTTICF
jgi:hypothetical protein